MLTLFASPKPFRGHIEVIQRNAIGSWTRLGGGVRVLLFGAAPGTAEVARELGVEHVPEVARNEFGTPLLSALFEAGRRAAAPGDALAYVNSDIVLLDDFPPAVARVRRARRRFLMVGECWNLDVPAPVAFEAAWQHRLRREVAAAGVRRGKWYIDYFVFDRDLYPELPPFAVGRAGFDNWLVWRARALGVPVIDASRVVTAVHQQHDYAHVPGGRAWSYEGPEAQVNIRLGGGRTHLYHLGHATRVLTPWRLRRPRRPWTRFDHHWGAWLGPATWRALEATRPLRHRLGLRAGMLRRLRDAAARWSARPR